MSYDFEDTPNYEKLKFLLEKVLLDRKMIPLKVYDLYKMQEDQ